MIDRYLLIGFPSIYGGLRPSIGDAVVSCRLGQLHAGIAERREIFSRDVCIAVLMVMCLEHRHPPSRAAHLMKQAARRQASIIKQILQIRDD